MIRPSLVPLAAALLLADASPLLHAAEEPLTEQKFRRVITKLRQQNQGYDGTETHQIENGQVVELILRGKTIKDLSALRGLPITKLQINGTQVSDFSPLRGMPLTWLHCGHVPVRSLEPLKGMALTELFCDNTPVTDLSPLQGMPMVRLDISNVPVTDLSPLRGMPLTWLHALGTQVRHLEPLRGLPLRELWCYNIPASDLSPLADTPLEKLRCDFTPERDREILQRIKTLKEINGKDPSNILGVGEKMAKPRPDAGIADRELQKDAKKFARNQSSIKGLYVVRTEAGLRVGGSQDIIATAERASSDRETICDFVTEVGKDTDISMEEAARLLKVRYPVWQAGYKIRFSYSNKYTKQGGGSAGGAFSVLLLSLLDGLQIDPAFAMTGDVTVDGKIREVGAVAEKIRGATLDKCRVIAIPESNKESLNDLVILYSQTMLWSAQIVSIATLDDAAAVARVDRAENLAKAMQMFGQVQRALGQNATSFNLRNAGIIQTLRDVLQLAPNHLSAEFLLRSVNNQLPSTLSIGASLEEIWAATGPLLAFLFADYKDVQKSKRFYFDRVPAAAFKAAWERLNWLQFRLHPKTRDLRTAMADYMTSLDQLHRLSSFSAGVLRMHLEKRDKVLGEAHTLGTDRKTLEEMLH